MVCRSAKLICFGVGFIATVSGCKFFKPTSEVSEQMDTAQTRRFGIPEFTYQDISSRAARSGFLEKAPWKDDYWPLTYKNVARRYFDYLITDVAPGTSIATSDDFLEFKTEAEQTADRSQDTGRLYRYSPAEKYDYMFNRGFPLTNQSWELYRLNDAHYQSKDEWGWMGICHGWALASYSELPPNRHVLVNKNGKSMMFFEGDIRALLSKVYAHNDSVQTHYMGRRCEIKPEDLRTDELGRVADFAFDEEAYGFFTEKNPSKRWLTVGKQHAYTRISMKRQDQDVRAVYLLVSKTFFQEKGATTGYLFSNPEAIKRAIEKNNVNLAGQQISVTHLTPCRDMNPAQFHAALVHHYSDRKDSLKKGFVFEIDRSKQVWNHPVWGFRSLVSAIEPIQAYDDQVKKFASSKATHVAEVRTKVIYLSEEGPHIEYDDKESKKYNDFVSAIRTAQYDEEAEEETYLGTWGYSDKDLHYFLEFEKTRSGYKLVGGEWGTTGIQGKAVKSPDFMWRVEGKPKDTHKGKPSPIRYGDIAKILSCANDEKKPVKTMNLMQKEAEFGEAQYKVVMSKRPVEYVECNLN